jgi:1-phosphofructokinase
MIVTLTPNPAVDKTIFLDDLDPGRVNRFASSQLDPAGKGINVSRMAQRLGWPTIAFGFVGGEMGAIVRNALDHEEVDHHLVPIPDQTRLNVTVVERRRGRSTNLYGPGPRVSPEKLERLNGLLAFWVKAGRVLVLAGSLPPGVPDDAYAHWVDMARELGVHTILDADDEALRVGIEARPHLIKPNVEEAQRLLGRSLPEEADVVEGARELQDRGIPVVVVSRGAEGTVCVEGDRAWRAVPPRVELRSTVGSGDSLVAGLAVALAAGDPLEDGLRIGTAAGAATAQTPGTTLGSPAMISELLPRVRVERID